MRSTQKENKTCSLKKRATDFSKSCSMDKKVFHKATVSTTLLGYFRKGKRFFLAVIIALG